MEEKVSPDKVENLRAALKRFLEAYLDTKVLGTEAGTLKMMVMLAKNNNSKIKDKMINYKLSEVRIRLLEAENPSLTLKNFHICEFLIEELNKYISSKLK